MRLLWNNEGGERNQVFISKSKIWSAQSITVPGRPELSDFGQANTIDWLKFFEIEVFAKAAGQQ